MWELQLYHVCYDFSIFLFHFTMNLIYNFDSA
nr:MAG TPA: hypothetical protein [Inoviridae sp.]